MVDVLDGGSPRPPLPRWAWVLAAAVVAAVLVAAVTRGSHHKATVAPTPSASPTPSAPAHSSSAGQSSSPGLASSPATGVSSAATPTPTQVPPPIGAIGTAAATSAPGEWPSAPSACGDVAPLPLRTLTSDYSNATGVVLVGGHRLQTIRLDHPLVATAPSLSTGSGTRLTSLAAGPHATYAEIVPCDPSSTVSAAGFFYRVDADGTHRLDVTGDFLVGGTHHAWVERFPPEVTAASSPSASGVVLVPLDGGAAITLEPNADLIADTTAGLVVEVTDPVSADTPPRIELVDATTGRVTRVLTNANALSAQGRDLVVESQSCGIQPTPTVCTLERLDLATGHSIRKYPLPAGRQPVSGAVYSPDGRMLAFQVTETKDDPRFETPFPPSDLAILHLDTGRLVIVPNLELAPKSSVGLAFDATGRSLLALLDEGDHGELLMWQEGMSAPALVVTVPGPFAAPPAVLLTGG
jgi:hypothetical protein